MSAAPVGVSALERLEALVANDALYELADAGPRPRRPGGRPRDYPVFMWLLFDALLSVYGTARRVEAELAHPIVWNLIRRPSASASPIRTDWLPERPMRRHHYLYGRTRYLTDPDVLAGSTRSTGDSPATRRAPRAARPGRSRLVDPPRPVAMLYADGKVVTPLFRAQPGDRARQDHRRAPPAEPRPTPAALRGHRRDRVGHQVRARRRPDRRRPRPDHLRRRLGPHPRRRSQTAMDCFARIAPHVPGAQGVIYDTALRGVHHQHLLRDLGILPVNKVTAAKAGARSPDARAGPGREVVPSRTGPSTLADGSDRPSRLFARGGAIGIGEMTDTGEMLFIRARARSGPTATPTSSAATAGTTTTDCPTTSAAARSPSGSTATTKTRARKFNRAENVRPIPPSDPDFERLYRRRNDAESINRHLDDTLWLRRAHSIGHRRQHLNLLTYALGVNALALHRHRRQRRRRLLAA